MISRRSLVAAAAALAATRPARAFGTTTMVDIAEIDLGPGTVGRPTAWSRLLYEMIQTTSVECRTDVPRFDLSGDDLFEHPFAVIVGTDGFAPPSEEAVEKLGRYLSYGGMLLIDDSTGADDGPFDRSARDLLARMFPTRPLAPLPTDHSIYRSFFLLNRPVGRIDRFPWLEAVTVGTFSPVILMRNDLSGALERSANGSDVNAVVPGGERQRREAVKLGVNLMMYALTADYKRDIAHVRQLMNQGRFE